MRIHIKHIILVLSFFVSGIGYAADKEFVQGLFPLYKLISGDSIYLYSDNTQGNVRYGYCYYDDDYTPLFSNKSTSYSTNHGTREKIFNSKCYSIIAPIFEKAQPFSEGYGTVSLNGKWAYIKSDNTLATDFRFDAAMPVKNGVAQVIMDGNIEKISVECLSSYRTNTSNELENEFKSKLIAQQFNESQFEKAHENAIKFINSNQPTISKDYSSSELYSLCLACSYGKGAQNQMMATTMRHMPDLYNQYSNRYVDANLSFLHSSPVLGHQICIELINSVRFSDNETELNKIKEYIEHKDYKRAVVGLESYYSKSDSIDYKAPLYTIYAVLLSLSNDFEQLWRVANNLTANPNDITLNNIVRNGLCYRFKSAIDLAKKAVNGKSICKHNSISLSLLSCLYSYHCIDNNKAKECYSQIFHNSKIDEALILEAYSNYILLPSMGRDYAKTLEQYCSRESEFAANLFRRLNILELSKEWGLTKSRIDQVVDCLIARGDKVSLQTAYQLFLFSKNILTDEQLDWQRLAKMNKDSNVKELFAEYVNLKSRYSGYNIFDLDEERDTDILLRICDIESEIKSKLFAGNKALGQRNNIDQVRDVLNSQNAIAFEFTTFHINDIPWYGAFVISPKSSEPSFVKLTSEYDLVRYKDIYREKTTESIQNFYASTFGSNFWLKFDLNNYNKIYFATTGMLDEIGLEYVPYKDGRSLFEDFSTYRVKSTANIPSLNSSLNYQDGYVALYGGLDYGVKSVEESRGSIATGKLKYSEAEVNDIDKILSNSFVTKKFTGKEGTTNTYRELSNVSPVILHFATHGYQRSKMYSKTYLSYENRFNYYRQNKDIEDEDWLLSNTGLRMSADNSIADSINNLLLSRDIANSRLQNTALVVLSACNTSDGSTSDSYDCVIGLNYAFQKAKVKNIITSLWNVYDKTSYEFMKHFYTALNSSDIHKAFYQSVMKMKSTYPNNPEIWSSFVLIEN